MRICVLKFVFSLKWICVLKFYLFYSKSEFTKGKFVFVKKQIRYFKMQIIQIWIKQICVSKNKSVFQKTDLLFYWNIENSDSCFEKQICVFRSGFTSYFNLYLRIRICVLKHGFPFWKRKSEFYKSTNQFNKTQICISKHKFVFQNTNPNSNKRVVGEKQICLSKKTNSCFENRICFFHWTYWFM